MIGTIITTVILWDILSDYNPPYVSTKAEREWIDYKKANKIWYSPDYRQWYQQLTDPKSRIELTEDDVANHVTLQQESAKHKFKKQINGWQIYLS